MLIAKAVCLELQLSSDSIFFCKIIFLILVYDLEVWRFLRTKSQSFLLGCMGMYKKQKAVYILCLHSIPKIHCDYRLGSWQ